MSGYQTNLLNGFAYLLDAAAVGTFDLTGAYTANQTGIVFKKLPQSPGSVIGLSTYPITDDPTLSDSVTGLQVLTRSAVANSSATDDLADLVFDHLHGLYDVLLSSGVRVVQCLHHGGGSLGQDDQDRWVRSDNYYVTTHRPSPNRT